MPHPGSSKEVPGIVDAGKPKAPAGWWKDGVDTAQQNQK
jgi:hypothetical protein